MISGETSSLLDPETVLALVLAAATYLTIDLIKRRTRLLAAPRR